MPTSAHEPPLCHSHQPRGDHIYACPHQPRERVQRALPPQGHTTAGRARARCSMHATRRHRRARPRPPAGYLLRDSGDGARSRRDRSRSQSRRVSYTHRWPHSDRTRLAAPSPALFFFVPRSIDGRRAGACGSGGRRRGAHRTGRERSPRCAA